MLDSSSVTQCHADTLSNQYHLGSCRYMYYTFPLSQGQQLDKIHVGLRFIKREKDNTCL